MLLYKHKRENFHVPGNAIIGMLDDNVLIEIYEYINKYHISNGMNILKIIHCSALC